MSRLLFRLGFVIAHFALIGCSSPATPTLAPTRPSVLQATAEPTVVPAGALTPSGPPTFVPTGALTPIPTVVPTLPSPTPTLKTTPTRTPTIPAGTMRVKLFFVALNDGGNAGKKIGCNDSIVGVDRAIPTTNAPLTAALRELFSLTDKDYGQSGLYNALYQSKLRIESISIVAGKATINLSGSLLLNGACDNPRVQAQIEQVALQFSTVKTVAVFLNNVSLDKVLSEKGG